MVIIAPTTRREVKARVLDATAGKQEDCGDQRRSNNPLGVKPAAAACTTDAAVEVVSSVPKQAKLFLTECRNGCVAFLFTTSLAVAVTAVMRGGKLQRLLHPFTAVARLQISHHTSSQVQGIVYLFVYTLTRLWM